MTSCLHSYAKAALEMGSILFFENLILFFKSRPLLTRQRAGDGGGAVVVPRILTAVSFASNSFPLKNIGVTLSHTPEDFTIISPSGASRSTRFRPSMIMALVMDSILKKTGNGT